MSNQPDPHTEWERQIFKATDRRHRAAHRAARRKARTRAILVELVLFAGILLLIALDRFALLSPVVAYPLVILMICVMCFFAGIAVSGKRR